MGPLSPTPDHIARAMAPHDRIFPTGAMAANLLRLSTQVPVKIVYFTNETTRTRKIAGQTVRLKRAKIPWLDNTSGGANLAIQALSYLGKRNVDEEIIHRCARILTEKDLACLLRVTAHVPGWMVNAIRKIEQAKHQQANGEQHATRKL